MVKVQSEGTRRDISRARKTVLIAGGAGFVGSHLCERLLVQGHEVLCIDNLQTGDHANIAAFASNPDFCLLTQDIANPVTVPGPVHEIYNLACPASPPRYQADPIQTARTCFMGALNLLELARDKGARILQASTSEVYGDTQAGVQSESDYGNVNTCGPRACYTEGKRVGETLFWEYGAHQGVETRIARIFNTYGPRMHPDDGRVVSNFVVQALRGLPLTIYGAGLQTRSFCYVDDLVEGLVRLMASDEKMPVNLGNPGEFTVLELAQMVLRQTGSASTITFEDMPQDDPQQRRPDISRARALLDWAPSIPLEEGLAQTISWFIRRLDADRDMVRMAGQ